MLSKGEYFKWDKDVQKPPLIHKHKAKNVAFTEKFMMQ